MIFDKNTIEFLQVALEFCAMIEATPKFTLFTFTDRAVKILPLLYLKATLLPIPDGEPEEESEPEQFITEQTYDVIHNQLVLLLGEYDSYLETFHADIQYSDTPVVETISESLSDVYQDIGNFAALFRHGNETAMKQALIICEENFRLYWGQKLLNALKALHAVRFYEDLPTDEEKTETK